MSELRDVFICDAVRTPIGRYGGALAKVRTDDLAAVPIKALVTRHPNVDWSARETWYSSATFSPVSALESTPYCDFISGLMKRQPIVES